MRFLEPQDFTLHMRPASVGLAATQDQSAPTPIALGSPAIEAVSGTPLSSSVVRSPLTLPLTLGSPSLPIQGSRIFRDTPYPVYEFRNQKGVSTSWRLYEDWDMIDVNLLDYKQFQEHIMGRMLLVNAPIETVESKAINSSRLRQESEKQYLRLWEHDGGQSLMYSANLQGSSPIYVEHNGT